MFSSGSFSFPFLHPRLRHMNQHQSNYKENQTHNKIIAIAHIPLVVH